MVHLRINSSSEIEWATDCIIRPIHPSAIGEYVRQGAFGAEFAIALDVISPEVQSMTARRKESGARGAHLGEVFAWGIDRGDIGRMREWACGTRLTLAESEEFAWDMGSVWSEP